MVCEADGREHAACRGCRGCIPTLAREDEAPASHKRLPYLEAPLGLGGKEYLWQPHLLHDLQVTLKPCVYPIHSLGHHRTPNELRNVEVPGDQ